MMGLLYIVGTPIGNIEDISLRAIRILKEADFVLAEDTRRAKIIFDKYGIKNNIESFNDFNEKKKIAYVIELLKSGKNMALVSDSGMPCISDPGYLLARSCAENNIPMAVVPGPSALISALVLSGFPTDKFSFYGFLSKKEKKKKDFFEEMKNKNETIIFYESPYRLIKTLKVMNEVIPEKNVAVCREMTKKFEEVLRGKVSDVYRKLKDKNVKGEIVVVLG